LEAIDSIRPVQRAAVTDRRVSIWYEPAKRAIDVLLASIVLTCVLPVLILASIAILLDSPGRVLYRRGVVGKGGRPFAAWKLRTMIENGDAHVTENSRLAEEYNNNHKLREDPRVTGVGKLLRKSSIDELPQLFNVLRGEMSLVGPRMISFPELEKFGEWQEKILEVKPGITGLWQVRGRGDLDYDERVRLNVYYVDNRSVLLDLRILAKTIPAVFTGKGAF